MSAVLTVGEMFSYSTDCHFPIVKSLSSRPIHTCLGLVLFNSTCILTLAIASLDLLNEAVQYIACSLQRRFSGKAFKTLQGSPGCMAQTGTMGVWSPGLNPHKLSFNGHSLLFQDRIVIQFIL